MKGSLLARVLIGGVFSFMGLFKILNWGATAGWMAMKGFPPGLIPILLIGAIIMELGGGLAIIFGYRVKLISIATALFLIPTNVIFHNFWALPPEMAASEQLSFLQNIAIMGGLLGLASLEKQQDQAMSPSKS